MNEAEDKAFEVAAAAYVEKFGYFPIGPGFDEVTTEQLQDAVSTGHEITEDIPDDATA